MKDNREKDEENKNTRKKAGKKTDPRKDFEEIQRYLKKEEGGQKIMCEIMDRIREEGRREGREEGRKEERANTARERKRADMAEKKLRETEKELMFLRMQVKSL